MDGGSSGLEETHHRHPHSGGDLTAVVALVEPSLPDDPALVPAVPQGSAGHGGRPPRAQPQQQVPPPSQHAAQQNATLPFEGGTQSSSSYASFLYSALPPLEEKSTQPLQHSILNASHNEPPSFAATLPSLSSAPLAMGAEGSQRKASPIRRKGSSSSKSRSSPHTTSHDNDGSRSLLVSAPATEGDPPQQHQQQQQALPSAPPLASSLYGPFKSVLQSSVVLRSVDAEPSSSSTAPTVHPSALHIRLERAAALVDDPLTSYLQAPTESAPLRSSNMPTTPTLLSVQGTPSKVPAMDLPLSTAFNASLHMTSTTNSNHSCSKPFSACGPLATLSSESSGGGGGVSALLADFFVSTNLRDTICDVGFVPRRRVAVAVRLPSSHHVPWA